MQDKAMGNNFIAAETLAALLAIAFVALALYTRSQPRHRLRSRRRRDFTAWSSQPSSHPPAALAVVPDTNLDLRDPAQQMHAIARVEFECTPLLNPQEARLLPLLESTTRDLRAGHGVMAQTSLGELIRPRSNTATAEDRTAAFASINSKRLDFAIIDRAGRLAVAVEYQGGGHHQGNAFMRDAVKREAVRRAGIPFIEVEPDFDPARLRSRITGLLAPATPAPSVTALNSHRP